MGTPFADNYIIGGASSAGEVIMTVLEELIDMGRINLTPEIAYPLYAAMSSDTGCFRYTNATEETLKRSELLMSIGIDFEDINHRLFNSKTQGQLRAEEFVAERIKSAFNGKVTYATVTRRDRQSEGASLEHFDTAIDVVRSQEGAEISFVIKEMDNGDLKASLRSTGKDVATVAAVFAGGGHVRAAGCTVKARGVNEAATLVLGAIKKLYYSEEV